MGEHCKEPSPHPSPACGGGSRPSLSLALIPIRLSPRCSPLLSPRLARRTYESCACAPSFHHDRNEREHAERRQRSEKLRRERRVDVELEPAVGAAGREAGLIGGLLRGDHAVEAGAEEGKYEGRRDDAERGCRGESGKPNPDQRRNEVDDPERKDRHQPQKQQITESVFATALRQPLRQWTRPA